MASSVSLSLKRLVHDRGPAPNKMKPREKLQVPKMDNVAVERSPLEARFREVLKEHVSGRPGCKVQTVSDGDELDFRLVGPDGNVRCWRMETLVRLAASAWTEPDFLLVRSDTQDLDVAIYLDGERFHASLENNRAADDARKRDALRRAGMRVWSITWNDVQTFMSGESEIGFPDLVNLQVQNTTSETTDDTRLKTLWANPIEMLVEYLSDPEADIWSDGSLRTVLGLIPPGPHGTGEPIHTDAPRIDKVLQSCLAGTLPDSIPNGPVVVIPRAGQSGFSLYICGETANLEPTIGVLAVLDDRESEVGDPTYREKWRDWLRWANILQFLKVPRRGEALPLRMVEIWTYQSAYEFSDVDIPLSVPAPGRIDRAFALPSGWAEVLHFTDASLEELITELARLKAPIPEPRFNVGPGRSSWNLELAWPAEKISVVIDEEPLRDAWLAAHGWKVTRPGGSIGARSVANSLWEELGG